MNPFSRTFIRTTAVCAIVSAITTLGVHLLPYLYTTSVFEEQLLLPNNPVYMFRLWMVLAHVLLVVVSMYGVAALKYRTSAGWLAMGMTGYLLFAAAELVRTSITLTAVNGWRAAYLATQDPVLRNSLKGMILDWPHVSDAFFLLLILGFLLGNFFYGIALHDGTRFERTLSMLLFAWSFLGVCTILQEFLSQHWLSVIPEFLSYTYQPLVRVLIGIWLWTSANRIPRNIIGDSA